MNSVKEESLTNGLFNQLSEKNTTDEVKSESVESSEGTGLSFSALVEKAQQPKAVPQVEAAPAEAMSKLAPIAQLATALEAISTISDPEVAKAVSLLKEKLVVAPTSSSTSAPQAPVEKVVDPEPDIETLAAQYAEKQKATEAQSTPKAEAETTKSSETLKKGKKMLATETSGKKTKKVKAAAKNVAAKEKDANPMSWGQNGPSIKLAITDLNEKELQVLKAVTGLMEPIEPKPITEIAALAFPDVDSVKANSWTRNSLRRLARAKLLIKYKRGLYGASKKGVGQTFDAMVGKALSKH